MAYSDKAVGFVLLSVSTFIFIYYSIWILLLPFLEEGNPVFNYFLPKEYAIAIPATLLVGGIVIIGTFIGIILLKANSKNKNK